MFEFQWPWLFVLILLPVVFRKWTTPVDKNKEMEQALKVPWLDELTSSEDTNQPYSGVLQILQRALLFLSWILLIVAIAKPVWVDDAVNLPISSRNIIVAVDLSGSMAQRDFSLQGSRISRLAAIKKVAIEFIKNRAGDRVGLILFADHAYLQVPLTRDRQTVMTLLDEAELGLAGERTALGDAIGLAVKKVQEKPDQEHVLILMTDGEATTGINIDEAIRFASKVNLKIYTIGIGASLFSSSSVSNKSKQTGRNKAIGNEPDIVTLKKISKETGGYYFRASNTQQLESIYKKLDELEPVVDISNAWHLRKDLFYIPLAWSCLFLMIMLLLRTRYGLIAFSKLKKVQKLRRILQTEGEKSNV